MDTTGKALAALDALSEIWAARVNVDHIAKAICGPPDRVERVKAMLKQAYLEGAYDGRTSHNTQPSERDTLKALCAELVLGCRYALDKSKLIELERRCKELGVRPFVQKESSSED